MSNGQQYYGGFFWVAIVSFIIPFFVAAKAFEKSQPPTTPIPVLDNSGVDHNIWDYLLKQYVADGLVDYKVIRRDHLFVEYIKQLGQANPDALQTREEKLALACNAYNAFVINGVVSHKIKLTVQETKDKDPNRDFFGLKEHIFAGQTVSLNDIEHKLIRPVFDDPRIHVALVCAAKSCPAIRPEAYIGDRIDAQLKDQSALFSNDPRYVKFDPATKTLWLSKILEWYGSDWDSHHANSYLDWIGEHSDSAEIKQAVGLAVSGEAKVEFFEYDWKLNTQSKTKGEAGKFSSGSSPDE